MYIHFSDQWTFMLFPFFTFFSFFTLLNNAAINILIYVSCPCKNLCHFIPRSKAAYSVLPDNAKLLFQNDHTIYIPMNSA